MQQKLSFQLFFLVALTLLSIRAQGQVVRYRNGNSKLWTAAQVDSLILVMNERGKSRDFTFAKYVKSTITRPDTIIYEYTLKGTNAGARADELKHSAFIGQPLPAFTLTDIAGATVSSTSLLGRPVVLNLWFTTCPPCIAEMPALNRIMAEPASKKVVFLALTYESKAKVQAFLKTHSFAFRQLVGAEKYCGQFTAGYPISIFVDRQGVIRNILGAIPMKYDAATGQVSGTDDKEFYAALKQIE